jgi:hypothetical protein
VDIKQEILEEMKDKIDILLPLTALMSESGDYFEI